MPVTIKNLYKGVVLTPVLEHAAPMTVDPLAMVQ